MLNLSVPLPLHKIIPIIFTLLFLVHPTHTLTLSIAPNATVISTYTTYYWTISNITPTNMNYSKENCTVNFYVPYDVTLTNTTQIGLKGSTLYNFP
jgi:hypothetical protein